MEQNLQLTDTTIFAYRPAKCRVRDEALNPLKITSMGRGDVSELRPPTALLFTLRQHMYGQLRWNDTDKGNPKNS
jgi:hypothetical protein